jgi:hypothetical protein
VSVELIVICVLVEEDTHLYANRLPEHERYVLLRARAMSDVAPCAGFTLLLRRPNIFRDQSMLRRAFNGEL